MDVNAPFRGRRPEDESAAAIGYLDAVSRHPAVRRYKDTTFDLSLWDGCEAVLDVGCGVGEDVLAMSERAGDRVRVVGADINPDFLAEAKRRAARRGAPVELRLAPADGPLPFADGEFGSVRADRVLQHVERPHALLGEMARVTGAGGRMVLSEPDWGALSISEVSPALAEAIPALVSGAFPSPRVGRQLAGELGRLGLDEVDERRATFTISSLAEADELLGLGALLQDAGQLGADVEAIMATLAELDAQDRMRVEMVGFIVTGTVPEARA